MLGEKLFAVGGYDGSGYLSLVEAYDSRWAIELVHWDLKFKKKVDHVLTRENCWKEVASLNTGRGGACVVVVQK